MEKSLLTRFRKFTSATLALALMASIIAPIGNVANAIIVDSTPPVVDALSATGGYHPIAVPTRLTFANNSSIYATITDANSAISGCEWSVGYGWSAAQWTPSGVDPKTGICLRGPLVTGDNMSLIYSFAFRGTDGSGNIGTGETTSIVIDNKAPTSSADTGSYVQNTNTISVPFTATDDYSDVKVVELFYNHNSAGWTTAGTGTVSPFTFDADNYSGTGTYDFYVLATDNVGNTESGALKGVERTVVYNTSIPTVELIGTSPVDTVLGSLYIDSGAIWSDDGSTGSTLDATFVLSGTVNTGALGTYKLEYIKTNLVGNTGSAVRTIRVVEITPPTLGAWSISPSYTSGAYIYHPKDNVTFTTTVADADSGVDTCGLLIQSTLMPAVFTQDGSSHSGTCTYLDTSVLAEEYSYAWVVTDAHGNTTTGATLTGPTPRGDFDAPVSSVTGTTVTVYNTGVTIPFTATDSGAVSYRAGLHHIDLYAAFNGAMWVLVQTYGSGEIDDETLLPYTLTHGTGTYVFYTIATDNVGNAESKVAVTEATITYSDLPPPVTTISQPPVVNSANKTAFTLTGTCTNFGVNHVDDNVSFSLYDLDAGTTDITQSGIECNSGLWTNTEDISSQVDGLLNMNVTQLNDAGSTASGNTASTTKDTVSPTATITYAPSLSTSTSGSTLVTLTGSEDIQTPSGWTMSGSDATTFRKIISVNDASSVTVNLVDMAGNSGSTTYQVTNIDTIAPVVTFVTTPVTIDATAYLIEGTASGGYSGVTIAGGAAPTTATIDGSGHFKAQVTLTQNTVNTILVTSTDFAGNVGTGSVVITESGATNDYASAIPVTTDDLQYVANFTVSGTGVSRIGILAPITFSTGNIRVTIPAGTDIFESVDENTFDYSTLGAASATVSSGLGANEVSNGAIEFGISGVGLKFTKPVKVEIPVTGMTSGTIPVKVKHGGSSTFVTTGLTNDPTLTCNNTRVYSGATITETNIATVVGGIATIYTCAASVFTAYSTQTSGGGSSGGGGGGSTPLITQVTTSTGTVAITPISTGLTMNMGTYTATIKSSELRKTHSKKISFVTNLKVGTIMNVYRILPNGKKIKIGTTRVLRNGKIQFNFRQAGKYEFLQK